MSSPPQSFSIAYRREEGGYLDLVSQSVRKRREVQHFCEVERKGGGMDWVSAHKGDTDLNLIQKQGKGFVTSKEPSYSASKWEEGP